MVQASSLSKRDVGGECHEYAHALRWGRRCGGRFGGRLQGSARLCCAVVSVVARRLFMGAMLLLSARLFALSSRFGMGAMHLQRLVGARRKDARRRHVATRGLLVGLY